MRSELILFHIVLKKLVETVASTFGPPSCSYSRSYLAFKLGEAVRNMSSSFSFKHFAAKGKNCWYGFMFFDFQTKTFVSITLLACWYSNSMICVDKPNESLKTQFICQLSQICCGIYSHADSVAVRSNHFLLFELLFDGKVLLNGHAITQNYVFVVF